MSYSPNLTLKQISEWLGGQFSEPFINRRVNGAAIDSRQVRRDQLFFAIPGTRTDGHHFIDEAIANGAAACVVEQKRLKIFNPCIPQIVVPSSREALAKFAQGVRSHWQGNMICVTGSVGKTTTRHLIATVLSSSLPGLQSEKNYNNELGVPLTLARLNSANRFAVVEVGASAVGEISRLAHWAKPQISIVTAIGPAHLETFGSIDRIAAAKCEIYDNLPSDGLAIYPAHESRIARRLAGRSLRKVSVGEHADAGLRIREVEQGNTLLRFSVDGDRFTLNVVGRHHLVPAAIAVCVARELGLSYTKILTALQQYQSVQGRSHLIKCGPFDLIDDTYNSNPSSALAACRVLREWKTQGSKHLVLGEMCELGKRAAHYHDQLGQQLAASSVDFLYLIGKHSREVADGAVKRGMVSSNIFTAESHDEAYERLKFQMRENDVVLVKGSRSMKMDAIVDRLQADFNTSRRSGNDAVMLRSA